MSYPYVVTIPFGSVSVLRRSASSYVTAKPEQALVRQRQEEERRHDRVRGQSNRGTLTVWVVRARRLGILMKTKPIESLPKILRLTRWHEYSTVFIVRTHDDGPRLRVKPEVPEEQQANDEKGETILIITRSKEMSRGLHETSMLAESGA
jgi:hypothetical protein